jgi:hypothetical protein
MFSDLYDRRRIGILEFSLIVASLERYPAVTGTETAPSLQEGTT